MRHLTMRFARFVAIVRCAMRANPSGTTCSGPQTGVFLEIARDVARNAVAIYLPAALSPAMLHPTPFRFQTETGSLSSNGSSKVAPIRSDTTIRIGQIGESVHLTHPCLFERLQDVRRKCPQDVGRAMMPAGPLAPLRPDVLGTAPIPREPCSARLLRQRAAQACCPIRS